MGLNRSKPKAQYIQECLEWLARRKAWIDQKEKQFHDQYPLVSPETNRKRLNDLEAWKFNIQVHEWELDGFIHDGEDW